MVRPEQIHDREPISWRLDNVFVLDPSVCMQVLKKLGYGTHKDDALAYYCEREKMILLKSPRKYWAGNSKQWRQSYAGEFGFSDMVEAQKHFLTAYVNTAIAEETIHGLFDYSLHRYEREVVVSKLPIPSVVIDHLNEAGTKLLLEEILEEQHIPHIEQKDMTDVVGRLPGNYVKLVFFGCNSPELDWSVLTAIKETYEKERQGDPYPVN